MSALEISTDRAGTEVSNLLAGRASLQAPAVAVVGDFAGSGALSGAIAAAGQVATSLLDVAVEASTLGALAINNAVLDAADADR